jgi:hypothetical protein
VIFSAADGGPDTLDELVGEGCSRSQITHQSSKFGGTARQEQEWAWAWFELISGAPPVQARSHDDAAFRCLERCRT